MRRRLTAGILAGAGLVAVAAGAFALGRASVDESPAKAAADEAGYVRGLADGRAAGVEEGRALQQGLSVPRGRRGAAKAAFEAGYTAGENDVFGGYDGGWSLRRPYAVTLAAADGPVTYRIASRTPLVAGQDYYLCGGGHRVCHSRR